MSKAEEEERRVYRFNSRRLVGAVVGGPGEPVRQAENDKKEVSAQQKPKKKKIAPQVSEKKPVYDDILAGYYGKGAEIPNRVQREIPTKTKTGKGQPGRAVNT